MTDTEREAIFNRLSERLGRKRHESLRDAAERIVVTSKPGAWQDPRVLKAAVLVLEIAPRIGGDQWPKLKKALEVAGA